MENKNSKKFYSILAGIALLGVTLISVIFLISTIGRWVNPAAFFPKQGTAMIIDPAKGVSVSICINGNFADVSSKYQKPTTFQASLNQSVEVEPRSDDKTFTVTTGSFEPIVLRRFGVMATAEGFQVWGLTPDNKPMSFEVYDNVCFTIN